jgi:hypothetical protein
MIYRDGPKGKVYYKRFAVTGVTRDKAYPLTRGSEGSKVLYFSVTGPGEAPVVDVHLKPRPKLRNTVLAVNFNDVGLKSRSAVGNLVTKYPVRKVEPRGTVPVTESGDAQEPAGKPSKKKPPAKPAGGKAGPKPAKKAASQSEQMVFEF